MFNQPNIPYQNALLRRLSPGDLASIEPNMERVALPMRTQLESTKSVIEHVYFLEDGIASVVAKLPKGRDTEVGLIGMEGMTGALVALGGDRAAHDTYMQLAGSGLRVPAPALSSALSESTTLKALLLLYVQTLYIQTSYTALVNARSKLDERLARWLLMCHDRVRTDRLAITHEFISVMLGVRRPGVTVAIQELEGRGLIRATRGEIVIRDRDGLFQLADGTYSEPEREYERLLGKTD
ncbi:MULTISPECIES: Crp/Fnr family transcriptional regulator [unclassified Mesorhizobium]|uniref:Crp/Fnr family transcriptional regulator n=1 Tax=Mesorhizobium TaxID=68287 RepID=UPI0003CFA7C4|nr:MULTISPECIES: Crp/Fnr family transcriptional regulator [unclassified Mesorhizobium]ESY95699.1 cyclic nucleotide-binding protein [Mesorhizobium sp. L48C026A00]RWN52841.1 MAG: Crp/Fnr family transcriptional regulator [Mesorhizobium sp.]RWN64319.1 MAG: Crp/Fnr family transcriptional regulator [Mesorhizobium sp.]RWN78556.1 MAG: Crp/Fnr family transcriptional regulator [Mesorhizobium sp.]RWN81159.1 MAG: Crp/Fnr family transcriptional regulator [Mesorhizobium sp.]